MNLGDTAMGLSRGRKLLLLSFAAAALLLGRMAMAAPAVERSVDAYVRKEMATRQIPGLAIAVIRHGRIHKATGYGYADRDFSVPAQSTTLFSVASVTKSLTAVGVMTLVEAGRLTLDDPIGNYLNDLPPSWREVKIRQLLNHTSGIPDVMANPFTLDTVADTPEETFRVLHDRALDFPPGSQRRYNQGNYMLLGLLIEKLSGQPYTQFCQDHFFTPLKLTRPTFGYPQVPIKDRAHVYTWIRWSPTGATRMDHMEMLGGRVLPSMLWPAGGLNISVMDFSQWLIALLNKKFITEASLVTLWSPTKLNDGSIYEEAPPAPWRMYGLGWASNPDEQHPAVGFSGGPYATFVVYPKDELAVIVWTNVQGSEPESLANVIARQYFASNR